jgi:uncharacterized membrane protein YphA (DoxX/SURF4 family)
MLRESGEGHVRPPLLDLAADLQWLLRLLLGTVFVAAGLAKLFYYRRFRDTLGAMEILSPWLTAAAPRLLPPVEVAVGVAAALGWQPALTASLLVGLPCCFLAVLLLYRWRGGTELVCGCFADFERKTATSALLVRNGLLLACGLAVLIPLAPPAVPRGGTEWLLASLTVVGVLLAWVLLGRLREARGWLRAELAEAWG